MTSLLEVSRVGGREPSDDEHLVVEEDGSFRMWRTVGWRRVGAFGGHLETEALSSVANAVAAAPDGETTGDVPRYAATETHRTARGSVSLGGSTDPSAAWAPVAELGRRLLNDLTDHPTAALELSVTSTHTAVLTTIGDSDVSIAPDSIRWWAERLDADGLQRGVWRPEGPQGERVPAPVPGDALRIQPSGFRIDLDIGHDWDLAATDIMRVWLTVGIADPDVSAPRIARLVAVAPASAGS